MRPKRPSQQTLHLKVLQQFPPERRYLVGVSGGRDSVFLLHQLVEQDYRRLTVCHLDHQLRGRSSIADAKFVERLATKLHLDFALERMDVAKLARQSKQSLETAGRTARYEFFARVARRKRCQTVFVGHHADDLVETCLMNLFRGTGPAGMAGMREISSHRVLGTNLTMVRPLLGIWREEINAYAKKHRIRFREDSSNESLGPVRNRIRRRVIPCIEKQLSRSVRTSIWRAATIAADEGKWLDELVDVRVCESAQLDSSLVGAQPRAVQRRIIQKWLQFHGVGDIDFELIERVRALAEPGAKIAKTNLPGDRHVRRRSRKIFLE